MKNMPILMVGNNREFLDRGGMIVLIEDDERLQFEVNLERVKRVGLNLNTHLLQIGREVRGK